MKIILLGSKGRVGTALTHSLKDAYDLRALSRQDVNILDKKALSQNFQEFLPDLVINCSAYTDVNGAQKNSSAYDLNVVGVQNLCDLCVAFDIPLIHFSTDYVYGGDQALPYTEEDLANPLNEYGKTKWQGECYIREHLKKYAIFRSCWLYSIQGRSFLNLVRDADMQKKYLTIVNDQIGCPTPISFLVSAVKRWIELFNNDFYGTYHVSSADACSWFEFACEIKRQLQLTLEIIPISTDEFNAKNPGQANRPRFSALNSEKFSKAFSYEILHWKNALKDYLLEIKV